MITIAGKIRRVISILCISVFALTSVPLTADTLAAERERRGKSERPAYRQTERKAVSARRDVRYERRRRVISPRHFRHGHVVPRLPRGYRRVWHRHQPYFYFGGTFYRSGLSGFVVVGAPVGAIVVNLPVGYQRVWYDRTLYYAYGGTFYRRVPAGYVVVDAPPYVVLEDDEPTLVQPAQTASGEVIVTIPVLNVRSGPALHYPKLYQVEQGYVLDVHGRAAGWLYVQLPNGEFGWVVDTYTRRLAPGSG